jgi:hypothetical protein
MSGDPSGTQGPVDAASPGEVSAVEEELLGRVVDAPRDGGLNPHGADAPAPQAAVPGDAAVDRTVQGAIDTGSKADGALVAFVSHGPRARLAFGERHGRSLYLSAILLLAVALLLVGLGVIVLRPGAGSPSADVPAGGSGPAAGVVDDEGAAPAQGQADGQAGDAIAPGQDQAGDAGAPGRSGGGQQPVEQPPAAVDGVPQSCLVPSGEALAIELADVTWREEEDGTYASWAVVVRNVGSETFSLLVHRVAGANAATLANNWEMPPTGWDTEARWTIDPDAPGHLPTDFDGSLYTSVEPGLPTLCDWEYTDRVVAVYGRPGCIDVLWEKLQGVKADPEAQEALLRPLAITLPIPDRMNGWTCPE